MSEKIKPLPPLKVKIHYSQILRGICYFLLFLLFWLILIVASINVLIYYIYSIKTNGWLNEDTMKYAIYLVIGAYFFLILDKKKIYDVLGIKKDLRYITIEETNINKKKLGKVR